MTAEIETVIEPGRSASNYWRDLWRYRELFQVLAARDFTVRYRQTVVGVAWAVVRPVLTMAILTVVFHKVAGLGSDGKAPYAILVMAGMLPWMFFSAGLAESANSLLANTNLVSKVYFPRIILPTATVVVVTVDFLIGLGVLAAMMVWYGFAPGPQLVFLPVFVLMAMLAALGPGLWITAVNVRYRDFRFVIPFIVQFGLYVSPVGFSFAVVPEEWRVLYALNPMVGVINGFRWSILGGESPLYVESIAVGAAVILVMLWIGFTRFRRLERSFADLI